MSNFITTNIRLPEEDYIRLKTEAVKMRKSLAAVIREKITIKKANRSQAEIRQLLRKRDKIAKKLKMKLGDFDVVQALREMRYDRN